MHCLTNLKDQQTPGVAPYIPQHIGIIMDGNGRWAKKRFLPRYVGHQKGRTAVKKVIQAAINRGVQALTLFAFSTENWRRPADEVSKLMGMFLTALQKEVDTLHKHNVRVRVIGDKHGFSPDIQTYIERAETLTQHNTALHLNIAANYGGRADIVNAVQAWQQANPDQTFAQLTPDAIQPFLSLSDLPEPDLLIRTGGEERISNFMIWQMAYAEFYFTSTLWPDFNEVEFDKALESFAKRQRRFGQTGEQVTQC
ncbi:polyprenyl diphosphate synthase [Thiomicrospira cyclica]|uniref:Ditrans,polycis-undecaprenyl-diphosphate synthase ((2E,6E)-farnesyl-diphosphate specific) n=1 Tax=Thiomicrospira cyclica (strain DSM 14477 / JCM 11371 / ALM1) TaxID=717773 RepID=F6DCZ8_THICA|nr:polyprenyl diphosphate synthase [Thiomicrospira cyclica]AEG31734.1 Undecaprenyl pyrophosphate synthase [Thiomicrospira cyclica ALM1]